MNKGVINIFDHISTWGISSKKILDTLNRFKEKNITEVEVRINSPGGSLFEGFSIFNQLRDYGNVTTIVDGIAASIASVIALAGNTVKAYKNSYIFVHNPWSIAIGDTNDMKDASDDLAKFRDTLIDLYKSKTGLSEDDLKEMCTNNTFLSSEKALSIGLIDDVIDNYPTKKFVALYSDILDENDQSLIDDEIISNSSGSEEVSNASEELISAVNLLKESFNNLKEDLTDQLDTSVQLQIDLAKFENHLNERIKSGSLLPSIKLVILDIIKFVTSEHTNESGKETLELMNKFDALLDQFPDMQLLEEIAQKPNSSNGNVDDEFDNYTVDDESFALHKKALSVSKGKNISYKDALLSITQSITNHEVI